MNKLFSRISVISLPAWEEFSQRAVRILTVVCIICAAVLSAYMLASRFFFLHNGFQYDELYSAITASPDLSLGYVWKHVLLQDINLPLFNVVLFIWNRIFPFTQFWVHLFSALLSVAAVVAAWVLAPKYWEPLQKYMFVSLLACSFILSAYGAIVRTYSLAVLLATVFSLWALRFLEKFSRGENPSVLSWLGFFIVGLLGAYSHFFCTALFFITALILFLYACYYKVGRAWSFFGTAVVFGLWCLWLVRLIHIQQSGPGGSGFGWWYITPLAKATYEILIFLFGPRWLFTLIAYGIILAMVSLISTYKKSFFKQYDIVLPLGQIVILLVVVAAISTQVNLWMDRYFLPAMPSICLLFAVFLNHLRKRHAALLVLWPMLLVGWVGFYFNIEHLYWKEYTGLHDAFVYLTKDMTQEPKQILVDFSGMGYPIAAVPYMLGFYIPPGKHLDMIQLTAQTAPLSWQTTPKMQILLPLCSQTHLIYASVKTNSEEDGTPLLFGGDTCVYTAHPVTPVGGKK